MKINDFEKKVRQIIQKYRLVNKKDKVIVAVSGGKDSMTVLYLLNKFGYNVSALHINLEMGRWSEAHLKNIQKFCSELKIPLYVYSVRKEFGRSMCYIKNIVKSRVKLQDCTICGIIRRWLINKKARRLGATKIATGHNLDDAAQTVLMNYFKGNLFIGLNEGPYVGVIQDKKFVQRVKPLYFIPEKDVENYSKSQKFPVIYERCPCVVNAYRHKIRQMLNEIEKKNPRIKENIVKSFLSLLPSLRKKILAGKPLYCKLCGEPGRNEICKACSIMQYIH
ncbi:MAG: TIGR00269 family protein [Candidatus Pacearchaeota archaeon]